MGTKNLILVVMVALVVACDDPAPPAPAPAPSASTVRSADPNAITLTVKFDDDEKVVTVSKIPVSLSEVLPASMRDQKTWRELLAKSIDDKRTMGVRQFAEKYRAHDVRIYVDAKGRPAVGIFRRIRDDMPAHVKAKLKKPHIVLVDAKWVHVRTKEAPAAESPHADVTVVFDGSEKKLDAAALSKLQKQEPPRDSGKKKADGAGRAESRGKRARNGWRLRDVVALFTDVATVAHVKLVTEDRDSLMIKGDALAKEDTMVLLRFNNRGGLGVSSFDGDGPPRRMRGVTKIIIASK